MKKSLRMLALIGTVVVISLLGVVSVWAGPAEQGTVPHPKVPPHPPSSPRDPFVTSGFLIRLPLSEIDDAPMGLTNVDAALVTGTPTTICFARPRWPGYNYQIRFNDSGSWVGLATWFAKGYFCANTASNSNGIYALQGIAHYPWATVK